MNLTTVQETSVVTKQKELGSNSFTLGYRPELDGFRGISILLVLVHHLYYPASLGGFLGVDMFFVLSGFLITSLLLQEWQQHNYIKLKDFYIRRLLRLMPAFFFIVLILTGYALLFLDKEKADKTFQGIWLTLSYTSNWFYAFGIVSADNPLGVTWSLAIEEQFYLIFPLLLSLILKFKLGQRKTLYLFVFAILGIALYRKMLAEQGATIQRLYYASDTRADGLIIGCLVAFLLSWNLLSHKRVEVYLKLITVFALIFLYSMIATSSWSDDFLYQSGGYTLVALSVAVILIVLVRYQPKAMVMLLRFPPLVWVGRVSYGLYLWHWTVRYFVYDKQFVPNSASQLATAVILSFALTTFSFYCVEKPFLRLKKRFSHA